MNDHPVADLRDMQASRAATRQYAKAARVHRLAAGQLKADGWDGYADEVEAFVKRLETAALAESKLWVPAR